MSSKKSSNKGNKAIYKYIHCNVFKRGVLVFIGDCESLRKLAKKIYKDPCEQDLIKSLENYCTDDNYFSYDVAARCYDSDSGQFIIHLPKFSFTYNIEEIGNLSHELLHAAMLLCDFIGVDYVHKGSNETLTYIHEYLLKEALDKEGYKKV